MKKNVCLPYGSHKTTSSLSIKSLTLDTNFRRVYLDLYFVTRYGCTRKKISPFFSAPHLLTENSFSSFASLKVLKTFTRRWCKLDREISPMSKVELARKVK